ncbi:MAG: mechanosensitive ion channel domain-containing protein [Actinomycetota bacterium]
MEPVVRRHLLRSLGSAIVAVAGMVVASSLGDVKGDATEVTFAIAGAVVLLVAGIVAVRAAARAVRAAATPRLAETHVVLLGFAVSVLGYLMIVLQALRILVDDIGGLLLGGALTGVIVGVAAQQTFANFFAGIVLAIVRPFRVGDYVVLRSGPLGGEYEGRVTDMDLFYIGLMTERGPVQLPNAGVLQAAIGPGARAQKEEDRAEEESA